MNLIVPINVQALRVSFNDAAKITNNSTLFSGPRSAYNGLPWRDTELNEQPGRLTKANVGANIEIPLGGDISEPLDPGIHLHWALPDGITHGRDVDGKLTFPAAPNRWLVTRFMRQGGKVATKQWIVESDYLMTEEEYTTEYFPAHRRKCVSLPVGWDIVSGTNPGDGGAVYYPPWRRLGRVFDLPDWTPQTPDNSGDLTKIRHLNEFRLTASNWAAPNANLGPLRAVGHCGPDFSAYYPDCSSVFGFHDTFADLDTSFDLGNATFAVSYNIIGWHSSTDQDPLQCPEFLAALKQAQDKNVSGKNGTPLDPAAVYAATVQDRYGWHYASGEVHPPEACLYAGQFVDLTWDTSGDLPDLGEPTLPKCYLIPPDKDESVRIAVANSTTSALAALLQYEAGQLSADSSALNLEFMFDALQLGLLEQVGEAYSLAQLEQAVNEHGFSSHPGGSLWEVRVVSNPAETRLVDSAAFMPASDDEKLAMILSQLNRCQQRMDSLLAVVKSAQRQLFLDWHQYIDAVFSKIEGDDADTLRDYLCGQILDLWTKFEAAFGIKTPASPATRNIPVFYSTPSTYIRYIERDGLYATDSPVASIAGQIASHANDLISLLNQKHPDLKLNKVPGPRYWQPHDPVFVATGDSLEPARRNGTLRTLPCRISSQIITTLSVEAVSSATALTGAQARALTGANTPNQASGNTGEAKTVLPLLDDMAALLGEAALLDPGMAATLTSGFSNTTRAIRVDDLQATIAGLVQKIGSAWLSARTAAIPQPSIFDNASTASGGVTSTWAGQTPPGLALNAPAPDAKEPFLALSVVWKARFVPFVKGIGVVSDTYAPNYVTEQFGLDENAVEFDYGKIDPHPVAGWYELSGSIPVSSKAAKPLLDQLKKFQETSDQNIPALTESTDFLLAKPLLSQGLDGVNTALLGLESGLQLWPFNPFYDSEPTAKGLAVSTDIYDYHNYPTHFVAASVGSETALSPIGSKSPYEPIRAGFFDIVTVDVVDVFGRKRRLIDASCQEDRNKILPAAALKPGIHSAATTEHQIYLPPRLTQSAKLGMQWLAADDPTNSPADSASSPICGWIIPNHLDNSLAFFSGEGAALGSLGVEGSQNTVVWRSPAGRTPADITSDLSAANPTLRDLALSINGKDRAFFSVLNTAIENAHTYIMPANQQAAQALAVLIGRPLAVVKAGLRLEVEGLPNFDPSNTLALAKTFSANANTGYDWTRRNFAETDKVGFPVRLGDRNHLEDGLVAYVLGDRGPFDAIYAPAASQDGTAGVVRPAPDTLLLYPKASLDPPQAPYADSAAQIADLRNCNLPVDQNVVTLLVDPCAKVHAATGILPVKSIRIPPEAYGKALRNIVLSFFAQPVLRSRQGLELPLPDEPGFAWGWTTGVLKNGTEQPNNEDLSNPPHGDRALFSYSPQIIEDGWLRLFEDDKS